MAIATSLLGAGEGPLLIAAPHPDDETLGAGGTLLRARASGRPVHWLIATEMDPADGWPAEKIARREREIAAVAEAFGVAGVHRLGFPAARLDRVGLGDLVAAFGAVARDVAPEILLLPHRGDAHGDHAAVHDAGAACAKWFRYPATRWTLAYETLSETDAALRRDTPFRADLFVDVAAYLDEKLRIAGLFGDELQPFPFPRSVEALRAQAALRGAACGAAAAEAFMLLRARI
jgi:LmbE family N-acetylglucosaminyl deacetylase